MSSFSLGDYLTAGVRYSQTFPQEVGEEVSSTYLLVYWLVTQEEFLLFLLSSLSELLLFLSNWLIIRYGIWMVDKDFSWTSYLLTVAGMKYLRNLSRYVWLWAICSAFNYSDACEHLILLCSEEQEVYLLVWIKLGCCNKLLHQY